MAALFEFQTRWADLVEGGLASKADELEARDQALEQFIADFSCGGSGGAGWVLRFTSNGVEHIGEQEVTFTMPFDCQMPIGYSFSTAAGSGEDGSIGFIFITGADVGVTFDSWSVVGDTGYSTTDPLFEGVTALLRAGDTITFDFSPEPFDDAWSDVVAELTFSCCGEDQTVVFPADS